MVEEVGARGAGPGGQPGGGPVNVMETPTPGEPALRWRSRARSIEAIEQELARIWATPNLTAIVDGVPERHVAARTSVMNLVVIARRPEIGERCAATIQRLTGKHPSRTLVVSPADPDGPSWLDAQIQAHCVLPRADAPETCAELIYVTAGGEAGRHLGALVAPLLIHDLPVTIWWPGEPLFASAQARDLLDVANRVVVDGSTWSGDGLERLRQMAAVGESTRLAISDFALMRQSRWREAIASIFDIPDFLPYLSSLRRIAVTFATHDPAGPPGTTNIVKPLYHVAWLASRLGLAVRKPLTPVSKPARPARLAGRGSGGAAPTRIASPGLAAVLSNGRSELGVVIRPVVSDMPSGTTLRVELLAERRGSELRADVTAEAEWVHVRVWQDGVEALDRGFSAPRRTDVDLLAEAIEAGGRDNVAVGTIRYAADIAGASPGASAVPRPS